MAWYVFALVDRAPRAGAGRGFRAPLAFRRIAGAFAAVERRVDVPPAEFGVLRKHQAIVCRLVRLVPAILPVRFGTLLDAEELEDRLSGRNDELAEAFALVRHRVQFTWRVRGGRRPETASRRPDGRPEPHALAAGVTSGADYLRRLSAAARPSPSGAYRIVRSDLAPLIAAERFQQKGAAQDALYHLVDAAAARRYLVRAARISRANPRLSVTGPWPPFAFAAVTL